MLGDHRRCNPQNSPDYREGVEAAKEGTKNKELGWPPSIELSSSIWPSRMPSTYISPKASINLSPLEFSPLVDRHGRTITDLRISVTDRCNYRCVYCRTG